MLGQLVRLARGAHDSAGKCFCYHLTFISLAGIIRVSIAEVRLGAGLRGSANEQQWRFWQIKSALQLLAERAFFVISSKVLNLPITLFLRCFCNKSHLSQAARLRSCHHLRNFFVRCCTFCAQVQFRLRCHLRSICYAQT